MMTLIPAILPPTILRVEEEQDDGSVSIYYNTAIKPDTLTDATLIVSTTPPQKLTEIK